MTQSLHNRYSIRQLPALSESRLLRFMTIIVMYVAQGIQTGLLIIAVPAYMAAQGIDAVVVGGFMAAIFFPWTLKMIYAPLMERYNFLPMGRRRPWIIVGTLGGALGYLAMSLIPEPFAHMKLFSAMAFGGSLCLAMMDVSIDALVIEIVPLQEQSHANSLMWGSRIISMSATAAGAAWLLNRTGLSATLMITAMITAFFAVGIILLRERPGERLLPWTAGDASPQAIQIQLEGWTDIGRSLLRVFLLPASVLTATLAFIHWFGNGLFLAAMPIFTVQDLGWTAEGFSNIKGLAGLVGGVTGMLLGGWLIQRFGKIRTMQFSFSIVILLYLLMAVGATIWENDLIVQGFIILLALPKTLITIGMLALAMEICWKTVSAVQFTLYMVIGNFGLSSGSALMGPVTDHLSFEQLFLVLAGLSVTSVLLLFVIRLADHRKRIFELDNQRMSQSKPFSTEYQAG
ncbi:MAG: MFS transporter [Candidatus Marinimicrobia bacterium]|nr:MFS transporter [Candidatus Neomarinimicrobiota bacterium]